MAKSSPRIAADICLYGNREIGFGWLATIPGKKILGDGEPRSHRSCTDCVWLALDEIEKAGATGAVRVFAAGGNVFAWTKTGERKYYGDLRWEPAPVLIIDSAQLV